jgi:hypothetical protein
MYVDGHEHEDVVEYQQEFINRWKQYERHFHKWDNDGNELPRPNRPVLPLILVTYDESTFYQNDQRTTMWAHESNKATPRPKGDGQSIMVSDFLILDWGHLHDGDK